MPINLNIWADKVATGGFMPRGHIMALQGSLIMNSLVTFTREDICTSEEEAYQKAEKVGRDQILREHGNNPIIVERK